MKSYVVDTNILMSLEDLENLVKFCGEGLVVPIYVIEELDNLKTKEAERGFKARRALRNLEEFLDNIIFEIPPIDEVGYWNLPSDYEKDKMDNKIINYARYRQFHFREDVTLLSNDLNVRLKCESLELNTETYFETKPVATGVVEVHLTTFEFADFLEGKRNKYNVPLNHYLVVRDEEGHEIQGIYKFLGDKEWEQVLPERLGSYHLGTISPMDAYQQCVIHSLLNDDFTIITGSAGSGKTLLSLAYCLRQLQSGAREKLIVFANPVKTRGASELGYYTGDRTEKLMQNSIGAMLSSKFGDSIIADDLMEKGKLEILPVSDIRGFEVGKNQIMYITEAQNLSVDLIKLAIQRCAEGSKIILEGDPQTQVDHYSFEGQNNGLKRAIQVFDGYTGFSHILLPNIYRSQIADRAEQM